MPICVVVPLYSLVPQTPITGIHSSCGGLVAPRCPFFKVQVRRSFWVSASLVLFLSLACCERHPRPGALSGGAFARLFADMAKVTYAPDLNPEQRQAAYQRVAEEYGLTAGKLSQTLSRFENEPQLWIPVLEDILSELDRLAREGTI